MVSYIDLSLFGIYFLNKKKSIYLLLMKAYLTIKDQEKFGLMAKLLSGKMRIFTF